VTAKLVFAALVGTALSVAHPPSQHASAAAWLATIAIVSAAAFVVQLILAALLGKKDDGKKKSAYRPW
jgi:hypothetical protein